MIVYFMCVFYSQWAHRNIAPRSQEQWDAFKFCRAVKSRAVNGSLSVPFAKGPEVINQNNVGRARQVFGLFLDHKLKSMFAPNPVLIPVPSKDGLIGAQAFRSLDMLRESLQDYPKYRICPAIRFKQPLQSAFSGGPRGKGALLPYMTITGEIPQGTIILVDDIVTSGGSLLDSYELLAKINRAPYASIVCGRTVSDSLLDAFGDHKVEIGNQPSFL
ncbi:MAG: phosphoribosyltransferase [Methylocystis silviterrae]